MGARWKPVSGLRAVPLAVAILAADLFGGSAPAHAHTPHQAIDALQVSPDYANDSTLFILLQNNLRRSVDRGTSWKELVNGLDSANILSSIGISPRYSTDNTLFVATDGGGVYVSVDGGSSFQAFNTGLPQLNVGMLRVVRTQRGLLVLAAGSSRGLFVSPASQESWVRVMSDDVQITALQHVQDDAGGYMLAGDSQGGVWQSNADLNDWRRIFRLEQSGGISSLAVRHVAASQDAIYVGTRRSGLLRTDDRGVNIVNLSLTWPDRVTDCAGHVLDQRGPDHNVRDVDIIADEISPAAVFVTTWHQGVLVSTDDGRSWSLANTGLSCDQQADEPAFNVPQFRELGAIAGQDWFLAGFNGLFRSEDAGQSWRMLDTMSVGLIRGLDVSLSQTGEHAIALGTYGGGAYVSMDDGRSWSIANYGLQTTRLADLQFTEDGRLFALVKDRLLVGNKPGAAWDSFSLTYRGWRRRIGAGLERRLGVSPNFGTQLFLDDAERSTPWPMQIDLSPDYSTDETMYVGLRAYGVWKSQNGGADWNRTWEGPIDYITALQVSPDFSSDGTVFAAARGSGILVSNDAGDSWHAANDGFHYMETFETTEAPNYVKDPPQDRAIQDVVLAVSPDYAADSTLLAGSSSGLFRSTDGAIGWSRIEVASNDSAVPVRAIAFSPSYRNDRTILVSLKGLGVFRSVDHGNTFEAAGRDLPGRNIELKFIEFSPNYAENQVIFGASDESVMRSSDRGDTWTVIDRPIRYEDWRGAGEGPIRFSAGWTREAGNRFSASAQSVSVTGGATASLGFIGDNFAWRGERCPDCGYAEVGIDGESIATVDLYNNVKISAEIFSVADLADEAHDLTIRNSGTKNERSTGFRVAIDAIDVSDR